MGFFLVASEEGCTTRNRIELCDTDYRYAFVAALVTFFALGVVNTIIARLLSINDKIGRNM